MLDFNQAKAALELRRGIDQMLAGEAAALQALIKLGLNGGTVALTSAGGATLVNPDNPTDSLTAAGLLAAAAVVTGINSATSDTQKSALEKARL